MKNRSREEIVESILASAMRNGITKTQIMYRSLLSYNQLARYLESLIEYDLLEYNSVNRRYKTTKKGLAYLDLYGEITDMMSIRNTVK